MIEKRTASIIFWSKNLFYEYIRWHVQMHPLLSSAKLHFLCCSGVCAFPHTYQCTGTVSVCSNVSGSRVGVLTLSSPGHLATTLTPPAMRAELLSLLSQGKDWFLEICQTFSAEEWCMISQQCFEPKWISSILYWSRPFSVSLIWSPSGVLCDITENTVEQICFRRTSDSMWLLSRWHFGSRHCAVPPKYCLCFIHLCQASVH